MVKKNSKNKKKSNQQSRSSLDFAKPVTGLNLRFYIFLFLAISVISSFFSVFILFSKPLEIKEVDAKFIIGENPGFDLNSSALVFGRIPPGGSSTRKVVIDNSFSFPIEVKILASRNIAEFVIAQPVTIIEAGKNASIPISVYIPQDNGFGDYYGKIRFEIYKSS